MSAECGIFRHKGKGVFSISTFNTVNHDTAKPEKNFQEYH